MWEQVFDGNDVNEIFNSFFKHFYKNLLFQLSFNSGKVQNEQKFMDYTRNNNFL